MAALRENADVLRHAAAGVEQQAEVQFAEHPPISPVAVDRGRSSDLLRPAVLDDHEIVDPEVR